MESKVTKEKLKTVVAMLEGKNSSKKKKLEEAKLNLLLNDPQLDISQELKYINEGKFGHVLVNFIDKIIIVPFLNKLFIK